MDNDQWTLRIELFKILKSDVDSNYKIMQNESNNRNRRNYVRSLFALYESRLASMRETIADILIRSEEIDVHKLYPLMDQQATINDRGKINKRPNQISLKLLTKYTIRLTVEILHIEENIFNSGWDDFLTSLDIRHRITHPKYDEDISISNNELVKIESGKKWWNDIVNIIFTNIR